MEYTLETFRAAATVGFSGNGRGFLSGASRPILVQEIRWSSMSGDHKWHCDIDDPDPIKSAFEELHAGCVIRDCLQRP
jgi:hypothetical protein